MPKTLQEKQIELQQNIDQLQGGIAFDLYRLFQDPVTEGSSVNHEASAIRSAQDLVIFKNWDLNKPDREAALGFTVYTENTETKSEKFEQLQSMCSQKIKTVISVLGKIKAKMEAHKVPLTEKMVHKIVSLFFESPVIGHENTLYLNNAVAYIFKITRKINQSQRKAFIDAFFQDHVTMAHIRQIVNHKWQYELILQSLNESEEKVQLWFQRKQPIADDIVVGLSFYEENDQNDDVTAAVWEMGDEAAERQMHASVISEETKKNISEIFGYLDPMSESHVLNYLKKGPQKAEQFWGYMRAATQNNRHNQLLEHLILKGPDAFERDVGYIISGRYFEESADNVNESEYTAFKMMIQNIVGPQDADFVDQLDDYFVEMEQDEALKNTFLDNLIKAVNQQKGLDFLCCFINLRSHLQFKVVKEVVEEAIDIFTIGESTFLRKPEPSILFGADLEIHPEADDSCYAAKRSKEVSEMTEEEMLAAAIAASLEDQGAVPTTNTGIGDEYDDDEEYERAIQLSLGL